MAIIKLPNNMLTQGTDLECLLTSKFIIHEHDSLTSRYRKAVYRLERILENLSLFFFFKFNADLVLCFSLLLSV